MRGDEDSIGVWLKGSEIWFYVLDNIEYRHQDFYLYSQSRIARYIFGSSYIIVGITLLIYTTPDDG